MNNKDEKIMSKAFGRILENSKRRSSVHVDIEIPHEKDQNKDTTIEASIEDVNKSPTSAGGKKRPRTGVNCSFMACYGGRSPDRKRKKDKDSKNKSKMMTFTDPTEDPMYEAETTALSGITENIENKLVIELIDKFSPVIRNFPEQIKQEMLDLSIEWSNKREIFIGAINFVIHGRKYENNKKNEFKEISTERLSELLVREIENRMPKYCRKCKEHYIVKINDCPELHCMWCRVGMHDCTEMNEMKDRPGIVWLCETCEPIFNTHYLPKLDPIACFEGFNSNPLPSKRIQVPAEESEGDQIVTVEKDLVIVEVEAEIHYQPSSTIAYNNSNNVNRNQVAPVIHPTGNTRTKNLDMRSKKQEQIRKENEIAVEEDMNKMEENDTEGQIEERKQEEKKKCWYWLNKKCKHGEKCKYDHPTQCKVMLESGRCPNSRCNLSHPKICRGIYYNKYCSRRNCWYIHPTNIKNKFQKIEIKDHSRQRDVKSNLEQNNYNRNWTPYNNNNIAWSQNQNNYKNPNPQSFLEQWPTPWETRKPLKMLIGNIVEEITKYMSM